MKLGIFINTDRHMEDVAGLTHAACDKGHEVELFVMDEGVRLLSEEAFQALCDLPGVSSAFCVLNVEQRGIPGDVLPDNALAGSQLNNAQMFNTADRIVCL